MCAAGTRVATPFGRDLCFLKLGEATRDAPHVMVYGNERADDTARSSFNRSADLAAWRERIARQPWSDAYVFFKHEDEAKGPRFATQFLALS